MMATEMPAAIRPYAVGLDDHAMRDTAFEGLADRSLVRVEEAAN